LATLLRWVGRPPLPTRRGECQYQTSMKAFPSARLMRLTSTAAECRWIERSSLKNMAALKSKVPFESKVQYFNRLLNPRRQTLHFLRPLSRKCGGCNLPPDGPTKA
jgi:hypothetical protein